MLTRDAVVAVEQRVVGVAEEAGQLVGLVGVVLPLGMLFFQGRYTVNTPVLTAGAVIVISPLVVSYLIFQRKFIEGLTAGATK